VLLGAEPSDGAPPDMTDFFSVCEHCFNIVFALELLMRLAIQRRRFFYTGWGIQKFNLFDALVVLMNLVDSYILVFVARDSDTSSSSGSQSTSAEERRGGSNLDMVRVVRFFRLCRALRVVRTLRVFAKLRVLVSTVAASFLALFWSMVLLSIVMLLASVLLCQALQPSLTDEEIDYSRRIWIYNMYGDPSRALYTVFELTFSGGWPNYARPLVEEVTHWYGFFFVIYISIVVFAMFRIITALFLKDTLSVAAGDSEMMISERMREKQTYAAKLRDFFTAADTSHDGNLSIEEFADIIQSDGIKAYLSILELDVSEATHLFAMLDDGDGMVSLDEFLKGAIRLKGNARSQDVITVMHDLTKLSNHLRQVHDDVIVLHSQTDALQDVVAEMEKSQTSESAAPSEKEQKPTTI